MPRIPLPALIVIAFPLALPVLMEPEKLIDPTLYVSMNEFPLLLARRLILEGVLCDLGGYGAVFLTAS